MFSLEVLKRLESMHKTIGLLLYFVFILQLETVNNEAINKLTYIQKIKQDTTTVTDCNK